MKKKIILMLYIANAIMLLWFAISFIDVILHNSNEYVGPRLAWNAFVVLFG